MNEFIVPPNHVKFKAKKIFGQITGDIVDCSIAYIEPKGGGPEPSHIHLHDHFFVVLEGCATIKMEDKKINVYAEEAILVKGSTIHSIWNESDKPLKMLGITVQQR